MAKPRVLVSSTCYDLYIIREQLKKFIDDMGYEPVLSENGDIFYSPDIHTHLSCLREVQNCDMIVLIIGKSFGSNYINDEKKSVTQHEHDEGYDNNIPMFTFVSNDVYQDYYTYKKIVEKYSDEKQRDELVKSIPFSSGVDTRVFQFIDSINSQIRNNACFSFNNFSDIEITLKKQWAGMIFDFLQQRKNKANNDELYKILQKIEIASSKIEKVTEIIATDSKSSSNEKIKEITKDAEEQRFFLSLLDIWDSFTINLDYDVNELSKEKFNTLKELLLINPTKDKKSTMILQRYLQEINIASRKSQWLSYLIDSNLIKMQTIYERFKIDDEKFYSMMKDSLKILLNNEKERSRKKILIES